MSFHIPKYQVHDITNFKDIEMGIIYDACMFVPLVTY